MENFLSEMIKINENSSSEINVLKEKVKGLNESIQKEQAISKILEEQNFQNSLIYAKHTQNFMDLETKLNYYENEASYLQNIFDQLCSNLKVLKQEIKEKEEKKREINKEINNIQEIIVYISKNNKIIEEDLTRNYFNFDLQTLSFCAKKKATNLQKKSFSDFMSEKHRLQAKLFKRKMDFSDIKVKNKQDLLSFSGSIAKLKYSPELNRVSLISKNEKLIGNLKIDLEEKRLQNFNKGINFNEPIHVSQAQSLISRLMNITTNKEILEKKINYFNCMKTSIILGEAPLNDFFENFQKKAVLHQKENLKLFSKEIENLQKKAQNINFEKDNYKNLALETKDKCQSFENSYREIIKDMNYLKFDLNLLNEEKNFQKTENLNEDPQTFTEINDINNNIIKEEKLSIYRPNTIQSIETQENILKRIEEKRKTCKISFFNNKNIGEINGLEHYNLKNKLNSLKEDHLLFSTFIDYRLDPAKFQKKIRKSSSRKKSFEISQYKMQLKKFEEITASEKFLASSLQTIENSIPPVFCDVHAYGVSDEICQKLEESLPTEKITNNPDIQKILESEALLCWGTKLRVFPQAFKLFFLFVFFFFNRFLNVILLTRKKFVLRK